MISPRLRPFELHEAGKVWSWLRLRRLLPRSARPKLWQSWPFWSPASTVPAEALSRAHSLLPTPPLAINLCIAPTVIRAIDPTCSLARSAMRPPRRRS
eukprot:scaffold37261_cov74-Phaeocystis_antarctica.AAC.3